VIEECWVWGKGGVRRFYWKEKGSKICVEGKSLIIIFLATILTERYLRTNSACLINIIKKQAQLEMAFMSFKAMSSKERFT